MRSFVLLSSILAIAASHQWGRQPFKHFEIEEMTFGTVADQQRYDCNIADCSWSKYRVHKDWMFYGAGLGNVFAMDPMACARRCALDVKCGAFEYGTTKKGVDYCSWWRVGVCDKLHDMNKTLHNMEMTNATEVSFNTCTKIKKCRDDEFDCYDGTTCIPMASVHDGIDDCHDGSDEAPPAHPCVLGEGLVAGQDQGDCAEGEVCLDDGECAVTCNTDVDCPHYWQYCDTDSNDTIANATNDTIANASNDTIANASNGLCKGCNPDEQYECLDGTCIPLTSFDDNHPDCIDGSDEVPDNGDFDNSLDRRMNWRMKKTKK